MDVSNLLSSKYLHAGVEVLSFAGIIFWFNKKNSELQEQINQLNSKLNQYEKVLNDYRYMFGSLESTIVQLLSEKEENKVFDPRENIKNQQSVKPKKHHKHQPAQRVVIPPSSIETVKNFEDLDSLLADELKDLENNNEPELQLDDIKETVSSYIDGDGEGESINSQTQETKI